MEKLRRGDPMALGPYRVLGRLGSGAMGHVFFAEGNNGPVALKVIQPGLAEDRQFRDRFRREVQAAQRVVGPYTATVLDADPDGDPPWMATEYVAGPTLQHLVEEQGPLPTARVRQLGIELATALSQMHSVGVVHRDLKPTNVLLPPDAPARVIDFGIALVADATSMTSTGSALGSAGYMAPEQVSATTKAGPQADVFALGALLFFAITGEPAFGTGPPHVLMYRVVHDEPDVSAVADATLRALIAACLAKRPDQRPSPEQVRAACHNQHGESGINFAESSSFAVRAAPTELYATPRPVAEPDITGSDSDRTSRLRRILPVVGAGVLSLALTGAAAVWLPHLAFPTPSAISASPSTPSDPVILGPTPAISTLTMSPAPSPAETSWSPKPSFSPSQTFTAQPTTGIPSPVRSTPAPAPPPASSSVTPSPLVPSPAPSPSASVTPRTSSTKTTAPIVWPCPPGYVCVWREYDAMGEPCMWQHHASNWNECSWARTHRVKSVRNAGSMGYSGVEFYRDANFTGRLGCVKQGRQTNLPGGYKIQSHRWVKDSCG